MDKQFNRNRKNLIVSYNNVERKIIFGFVNEMAQTGKSLDYYVLDSFEATELVNQVIAIKELFDSMPANMDEIDEDFYVRPKRIKLPASEKELAKEYLNELATMAVSLPLHKEDHDFQEKVINTCRAFIEALGYDHEFQEEYLDIAPFARFNFKRANKASEEEITVVFEQAKKSLENRLLPKPAKEPSSKITDAAIQLTEMIKDVEELVIRFASLVIIKSKYDNKQYATVQELAPHQVNIIDRYPKLMKHPSAILDLLDVIKKEPIVKSWRKP